ncbi:Nitroreductase [Cognatiyoonia koreensis]|uniref:Nitroreductase n=2 Tax=Cognatiyoonia koreensis TaxID=364200 RepID=A0A1I0QMC5_9RHOB|nr:Nitroreductase [Cognatiyoonia koreensis]
MLGGLKSRLKVRRDRLKVLSRKRRRALSEQLEAEGDATRAGLARFAEKKTLFEKSSPLLRRNIHRLEKGLAMPERRPVFAESFIGETVALYTRLIKSAAPSAPEVRWAHDVLTAYFAAVQKDDGKIAAAYKSWSALPPLPAQTPMPASPYALADQGQMITEKLPAFETFAALCRARRSQRWFSDAPLPMDQVRAAMDAALQAPSACNRQPFDFYLVQSREKVKAVTSLPLGTAGFGDDLPAVIAVVGDLSNFAEPRDRHLIFIDSGLVAMQFMLALTAQGLGSVPINWPDLPDNHDALRDILGLAPHQVPIMLIGLGVPDPTCIIPYSGKRPADEVLHVID